MLTAIVLHNQIPLNLFCSQLLAFELREELRASNISLASQIYFQSNISLRKLVFSLKVFEQGVMVCVRENIGTYFGILALAFSLSLRVEPQP